MKCNECRHKETRGANEYCTYHDAYIGWHGCEYGEPKPQTNADHIRSMTDEELAKYLAWLEDEQACYQWEIYGDTDRISEWRDWLKSPMEEVDE